MSDVECADQERQEHQCHPLRLEVEQVGQGRVPGPEKGNAQPDDREGGAGGRGKERETGGSPGVEPRRSCEVPTDGYEDDAEQALDRPDAHPAKVLGSGPPLTGALLAPLPAEE